jgi:ribose transport system permease protein
MIPVITLALLLSASIALSSSFLTPMNIFNLLRQNAGLAIVSMGMLMVILTGGIDLSVGSMVALGAVLVATFSTTMGLPVLLSIVLTTMLLMVLGACAAYFVSFRRMAPFVVTLAVMTVARGAAFMISQGKPINLKPTNPLIRFGKGSFLNLPQTQSQQTFFAVPYPVWAALAVFVVVMLVLRYTSFGRLIRAVGSNESAVRLSGIRVGAYKFSVYVLSAGCCALGGVISASRAAVGSAQFGEGLELDAIAAVVIGGASLTGGSGTALNTLMGVLILGLIGNIMNLMNIPSYPQQIIKGAIIILAALLQSSKRKDTL